MYREKMAIPAELTPFGFCIDNQALLNIVTHKQFNQISRLKLHIDGGKDFFKISVNIISMKPRSSYMRHSISFRPGKYDHLRSIMCDYSEIVSTQNLQEAII